MLHRWPIYGLYLAFPILIGFAIYTEYWLIVHPHIGGRYRVVIGFLIGFRIVHSVSLLFLVIPRVFFPALYCLYVGLSSFFLFFFVLYCIIAAAVAGARLTTPHIVVAYLATHTFLHVLELCYYSWFLEYHAELAGAGQIVVMPPYNLGRWHTR
ncbi:hypothetical protein FB451DRAFT_190672 [Mycena latifolia]|nr:hypothetical protein FB451DRAFT_190672 [Mycena latifolia]